MKSILKLFIGLVILFNNLVLSQGFKIETNQGTIFELNNMICTGGYWTEAEGKIKMEVFSGLWNDAKWPPLDLTGNRHKSRPVDGWRRPAKLD